MEFHQRLNEINTRITDYLLARDLEKNEIIKQITSGHNVQLAGSGNTNDGQNKPSNYFIN